MEMIRASVEAWNRTGERDFSAFDPEIVWDLSRSSFPDKGVYRGVDGVRDWFEGLADAFGDVRYEVEKVRDLGEQVAVLLHVSGRGPSSRIQVEYRFVPVFTFHDGKVVRMDRYDNWTEAIEVAGLSE